MTEKTAKALADLCELEEFLREKLERLKDAGDASRTPLANALGEVQALLSLGLKGVSRRGKSSRRQPRKEKTVRAGITRKPVRRHDRPREPQLVDGEFVLEYHHEVAALARECAAFPQASPETFQLKVASTRG